MNNLLEFCMPFLFMYWMAVNVGEPAENQNEQPISENAIAVVESPSFADDKSTFMVDCCEEEVLLAKKEEDMVQ